MTTARTLVAIATYNEIENLPGLVEEVLRTLPDADVLVVDDNSPDGTGRWCNEQAVREPRLRCFHRPGKLGLGSATLAAFEIAIDGGYDSVATMDADWSHDPSYLPTMVAAAEHADVVIGSRYCPGGAIDGWPWHRRVLSRWINGLSRRLLRLPIADTSGAFRVYRVGKLRDIRLEDVRSSGYAYLEEILSCLDGAGATFAEVPITFRQRRAGRSKINTREAVGKLAMLGRLACQSGRAKRPRR